MDGRRGYSRRCAIVQPHHHAVGGAGPVDHGHAGESGPLRLEEQRAPRLRRSRYAVDQDGERGDGAGDFERDRSRPVVSRAQIEPRAIGRKEDMQLRLRLANAVARLENV